MGNKRYSDELKEKIVKEYLAGARLTDITSTYEINKTQVRQWTKKWRDHGSFPDGRGKAKTGRPKVVKIDRDTMTEQEYIAYLEMELDILKYIAFLEKRKQR